MVHTTNNLWVLIAALLVFTMTISVGFLEVGEMGEALHFSLLKTILITGRAGSGGRCALVFQHRSDTGYLLFV